MPVELVKTRISPDLLDTIGKSFKFRHAGGVAEWLKNALDNYLRLRAAGNEPLPGGWPVILAMTDARSTKDGPNLAVIDFGGTTLADIDEFFLHWGSRSAASLGNRFDSAALTGGHGNGGKFYMREMWRDGSRFLTFRDDTATSLVVEKRTDGNSGYWEFKERHCSWRTALELALAESEHLGGAASVVRYLEEHQLQVLNDLDSGSRGFTAVVGRRAAQLWSTNDVVRGGKWDRQKLVDALRDSPQARRPIRELNVSVLTNGSVGLTRLSHEDLEDDPDWTAEKIPVPASLVVDDGMNASPAGAGTLTIRKAIRPLSGRLRDRNALAVLDDRSNPIGMYPMKELPLPGHSPLLEFLHAELELDFVGLDGLVQNDRERLVRSATSQRILEWVTQTIWAKVDALERANRERAKRKELETASILNDELNRHAKRFLEDLQTKILVDVIDDPSGGGLGGVGGDGKASGGKGTGGEGSGGKKEVEGTGEPARRPRSPQVLLSGYDSDPAAGGEATKYLTDRHPPLEQDDVDKNFNVWWINTEHPFARETFKRGGAKGLAFRNYQLHMFRDVVQREALRYRQRRESELSLDRVENELTDISNRFLAELPHDLVAELLD